MLKKNKHEHLITSVEKGSIAEEMEIEAGDLLLEINKQRIEDIFDYRYLIKNDYVEVLIRKSQGEEWLLEIDKDYDDDLGVEFESEFMDKYNTCTNKCMFCFIDQMPPGMRKELYFKDDDSRLSFMQGNYITLTNMRDEDIDRIIKLRLAPIYISIHTTNPKLRCKMLHNRFAGDRLKYLDRLYQGEIEMNGQIVLCKGVNDGKELERTLDDLEKYLPYMKSVSVVPAGITKYREGLYPLEVFTKEEAGKVIDTIEKRQKRCFERFGIHFVHASDEFYFTAEREFPEEERYDDYIQLENGVGMIRLFKEEFNRAFEALAAGEDIEALTNNTKRNITIATGTLIAPTIREFAKKITSLFRFIRINVYEIRNEFFGETITVTGLITGQDIIKQLKEKQACGEILGEDMIVPSNMVRIGDRVFLDDMSFEDVENALGLKITVAECSGGDFIEAIINRDYNIARDNGNFVYIKAGKETR